MQDPEPPQPPDRWKPHQSVVGGAAVGGFIATLIIKLAEYYFKTTLDSTTAEAITGLCLFGATYLIPDGRSNS